MKSCFKLITSYFINKMFDLERKKASFNGSELSELIYGSQQKRDYFMKAQEIIANDPVMKFDPSFHHQSRLEMIKRYAEKLMRFHEHHDKYPLDGSTQVLKLSLFNFAMPFSLHSLMFLTTLRNLCTQEQEKLFLQPALRGELIGCYAQTELAHGSDVQNLMTTATYDPATEEFIINTPDVKAAKWWIGDLGLYCTHAAVFAQLIVNGKRYGVHVFVVPIRDPKTYKNVQSVESGDVGPKLGFTNKDNGYAIFKNTRIPRVNMLMKYQVVSKEGVYSKRGDQKISYATMLLTRSGITEILFYGIAKSTTILTRYSLVRKQFKDSTGREIPVLDYQTQQEKVIPRIAESFAANFCYQKIAEIGAFVFEESKKGRFDKLNEAHILTSATKAILSYDSLKGMQTLRKAAGGHGFHMYNGVIGFMQENSPSYTLQGQFTVLILQVARFLTKSYKMLQKGKELPESAAYLMDLKKGQSTVDLSHPQALKCPHTIKKILTHHSCFKTQAASKKIMKGISEGLKQKSVLDAYAGLTLNDAGIAHCYVVIYTYFHQKVATITNPAIKAVLTKLLRLYGIEKIIERSAKFFESQTLDPAGFQALYTERENLLAQLRPEALSLVQAFEFHDNTLMSAIGSSDGKAYENLIDWAKRYNTINRKEERDQIVAAIKEAKQQIRPAL